MVNVRWVDKFPEDDLNVKLDVSVLDDAGLINDVCRQAYDWIMVLLKKYEDNPLLEQQICVDVIEKEREWQFYVDNEHKNIGTKIN